MSPYTFIISVSFIILVRGEFVSTFEFGKFLKAFRLDWFSDTEIISWLKSPNDVKFHVYNRRNFSHVDSFTHGDEEALARCRFKRKERSIMYIHGWNDDNVYDQTKEILETFQNNTDHNIILVNWSKIARSLIFPHNSAEPIGKVVALTIKWLGKRNLIDISDLHIIGFSMGAHIAGFAGRHLAPQKIRRITGLDPAGPRFELDFGEHRGLNKTDAKFVDIIHTSHYLGMVSPIGHVDFYPNDGKKQKNCERINLKCSHAIAIDYYLSSISNPTRIVASRCDFKGKQLINCRNPTNITVGFYTNPYMTGIFRLNATVFYE